LKINKILSILLTFCLIFGAFQSVAMADNTLIIREGVIFDLQSYGILQGRGDGELALDDNVTRAEFCAFVVRLMGAPQVSYFGTFSDVKPEDWFSGDVAALSGMGLINGNGQGEFLPYDSVTYTDAVKILVCALGYKVAAQEAGGYPNGYINIGSKIRLNRGISAGMEDYLTRGAVILMLHNALDIEILEPVSYGDADMTYGLGGKTFRSLFSQDTSSDSVYMATGVVTADYYSYLLDPVSEILPGQVQINDRIYNIGTTNTDELLGMEVEYYYKENGRNNPTIVNIRVTDETTLITLDGDDIENLDTHLLSYFDKQKNKEVELKLSASLRVIKNYQLMDKSHALSNAGELCKNGSVKVIDNNGDRVYDLIIVQDYKSYRVGRVAENGIYLADNRLFEGSPFVKLDTDDDKTKIILLSAQEEEIKLSDIKEDDVVSLLQSEDKTVIKCVRGKDSVYGNLTEYGSDELYIDNIAYLGDYYFSDEVNVGNGVVAYLDFKDKIVEILPDDSSGKNYAYILDATAEKGISGEFCLQVLIPGKLKPEIEIDDSNEDQIIEIPVLKAYNKEVDVLNLADSISYNRDRITKSEYPSVFSSANLDSSPEIRVISYRTNSEGFVTSIESAQRIGDGNYKVYNGYENVFGKEGTVGFGITEQSGVVCIPENAGSDFESENYYATLLINNGQRYQITGYNIDPENHNADMVVIKAPMDLKSGDVIGGRSKLAVLSKISQVSDDNGDVKSKLEFYSEGKKMSYFVSPGSEAESIAVNMSFGDVFYYALDNVDEVYKLKLCALGKLGGELSYGESGSNDTERSILGTIANIDYNIIDIYENRRVNRVTVSFGTEDGTSYDINRRNTPPVYLVDTRLKTVTPGSIDDILIGDGSVFANIIEYSLKGIVVVR